MIEYFLINHIAFFFLSNECLISLVQSFFPPHKLYMKYNNITLLQNKSFNIIESFVKI